MPIARRFHFGAGQSNAAFVGLEYMEIVVSLSICCHHFVSSHKTEACKPWSTSNFPREATKNISDGGTGCKRRALQI